MRTDMRTEEEEPQMVKWVLIAAGVLGAALLVNRELPAMRRELKILRM